MFFRFQEDIINTLAGLLKLLRLMLFPDISLHHTDGAYIFLYGSVQLVILRKSLFEILHGAVDNEKQHYAKQKHCHKVDGSQPRIDEKSHGHGADHADRGAETDTQDHLVCHLHIGHVRGQSCHKPRRAELVKTCKGKGLDVFKHRLPQIFRKSRGRPGSVLTAHNAAKQPAESRHNHYGAYFVNMLHIPGFHTIVNNGRHQKRNQHFENDLQYHKYRRHNRHFLIFLYLCCKGFYHILFLPLSI